MIEIVANILFHFSQPDATMTTWESSYKTNEKKRERTLKTVKEAIGRRLNNTGRPTKSDSDSTSSKKTSKLKLKK